MKFLKETTSGAPKNSTRDTAWIANPRMPGVYGVPKVTKIWSVGGGKGGVGKSLVASNMGVLLTKTGKRVLLVDADLGAANLHTLLGVENCKFTLSNFFKTEGTDIRPYINKTDIPNLDLVSGANDSLNVADQSLVSIRRLEEALLGLPYDYVIMDVGPGTSKNNLDLFLIANDGVLVTTPDPTSIENTYRFLKCLILRRIYNICNSDKDTRLKGMLNQVFDENWKSQMKTVSHILRRLKELDPKKGAILKELMDDTSISLIVNQVKNASDSVIGPSISRACYNYFGIKIGFLGEVRYEEAAAQSVRFRKPLVASNKESCAAKGLSSCFEKLVGGWKRHERSAIFR